jgi:hypothetical protein
VREVDPMEDVVDDDDLAMPLESSDIPPEEPMNH